jgi:hypothetical protein
MPQNDDIPLQYLIGDWCLFDHGEVLNAGDSVFVFSQQGRFGDINTLIIRPANTTRYNATYYQGDSLNLVYNADGTGTKEGPKFFFEAVAFRVDATRFNQVAKRLDKLLDQTGPESHIDMIDGNVFFFGSFNGKLRKLNDGPAIDKWNEYSTYVRDSVIRPFKESREQARREFESNR